MITWTVSNYHKKMVEEHETYVKDDKKITRIIVWRVGSWGVQTNDDNPPDFKFIKIPGSSKVDSINLYDYSNNIEDVMLDYTWDGCFETYEFSDNINETEKEELEKLIDEEGFFEAIEDIKGWKCDDSASYISGPILIENENGYKRIIIADENGNVTDFIDENEC